MREEIRLTGLLISPELHYYVKTIHGIMESLSGFGLSIVWLVTTPDWRGGGRFFAMHPKIW
jgi:hypothetical protein